MFVFTKVAAVAVILAVALVSHRLLVRNYAAGSRVNPRAYELTAVGLSGGAAVVAGMVIISFYNSSASISRASLMFLVPIVAGIVYSAGVGLSTVIWPRSRARWREATLSRRAISTVVPRRYVNVLSISVASFVLVSVIGTVLSAGDGKTFGWGWNQSTGVFAPGRYFPIIGEDAGGGIVVNSMFPGWFITVPVAAGVGALLAFTCLAAWAIQHRPADENLSYADDAKARNVSTGRLFAVATGSIATSTGGLVALAGAGVSTALPEHWVGMIGSVVAWVGVALVLAAFCATLVGAAYAKRIVSHYA